ncbi:hypothetical protein FNF31_04848 [Cafeteria roenbergensis]|uniref:Uncharacterized protein n=1 Tax=Cafeteria roenbergensis TaxID=33653 RepID=A0A5A8D249_CAFRO|nr:hypothetical protein FNF31_04848 [Cafeteria roenbergensis]
MIRSRESRVRVVVAALALCWGALASASGGVWPEDTNRDSAPSALGAGHGAREGEAPMPGLRPRVRAGAVGSALQSGGGSAASVAASLKYNNAMDDSGLRGKRSLADPSPTSAAPPADDTDDLMFGFAECPSTVECCLQGGKLVERGSGANYEILGSVTNHGWPEQACAAKGWVPGESLNITVVANRARLASAETTLAVNLQAQTLTYGSGETMNIIVTKTTTDSTAAFAGTYEQRSGSCDVAVCCCPNQLELSSRFVNGTMVGFDVVSQLDSTALSKCKSQFKVWGAASGSGFRGIGDTSKFVLSQEGNQATFTTSDDRCTFNMVHTKNAQGGAFIESDDIGLIVGATVGGSLGLLGIVGGGVWVARTRRTPPMAENSDDSVMKLNSRSAQAHDPSVGDEAARSGEYEKHTPVSE